MNKIPEISRQIVQECLAGIRRMPPSEQEISSVHEGINQELVMRAQSFAPEGEEPTQQMWHRAYEEIYREEILLEDEQIWDPMWTADKLPTASNSNQPEVPISTVSRMLVATSEQMPQHPQVVEKWKEINRLLQDRARGLTRLGEEPTQQMWTQAFEETVETEILDPLDDLVERESDLMISPEVRQRIEEEAEAEAEKWDQMPEEERAEYAHQLALQWLRERLTWWLRARPEPSLEDEQVFDETLNLLWKDLLRELNPQVGMSYKELRGKMMESLNRRMDPSSGNAVV